MAVSHKSKRVELRAAGENQSIFNSNNYSPPLPAPALLPPALQPPQPSPAVPPAPAADTAASSSSFTALTTVSTIVAAPITTSQTQNQEFRDKSEPKDTKVLENSSTGSPKKDDKTTVLHIQLNGLVSGSKSAVVRLLMKCLEEFQAQNGGSDGSGTEMEQEVLEVVVAVKRRKDLAFAVHDEDGNRAGGWGENELDSQELATGSILTIDERSKVVVTHDTNNNMPHNSSSRSKTQSASSYPQLDGEVGLASYQYEIMDAQKGLEQLISRVLSSDDNKDKEPVTSATSATETSAFSFSEAEVATQIEAISEVIPEIVQLEQKLAATGVSGDLEATKQVIQDWIRSLQAESGSNNSSVVVSALNEDEANEGLAERKRRRPPEVAVDEVRAKQWVYHLSRLFEPLADEMIRTAQAADDYDIIRAVINAWVRHGLLPAEKELNRFLVNRKSVAIAAAIHRKFGGHGKKIVKPAMEFYESVRPS